MSIFIFVLGIVLFSALIVVHEWGHFIFARRNGVEVEEFAIFFGPKVYQKKTKNGWLFSIRSIPVGGYVKLKGEHDSDTEKGTFGAASLWVKTKIMAGGVFMNIITAFVLLSILSLIGLPKLISNQFSVKSDTKVASTRVLVNGIVRGSPAQKAGLKNYDQIVSIQPKGKSSIPVSNSSALPQITKKYNGQDVSIKYSRNGQLLTASTILLSQQRVSASQNQYNQAINNTKLNCANINPPKGYLGVSVKDITLQRSTWSAPVNSVGFIGQTIGLTFKGIGQAFSGLGSIISGVVTSNSVARDNGECSAQVFVGPVGIFYILKETSAVGFLYLLTVIALISLALGFTNILPIPALDGGRLWLMLISRAIKKPVSAKREELINAVGFFLLVCLLIIITISDVNLFKV